MKFNIPYNKLAFAILVATLTNSVSYATTETFDYSYDLDNKLENITQPSTVKNSNTTIKLTYDANGNLSNDGEGHSYTYNSENELVSYLGGSDNTETTATYTYYPNHMRANKRINNGQTVNYYYNGDKYAQIVNESIGNSDYTSYAMLGNNRYVRIVHQSNNLNSSDTLQYLIKDNKNIIAKLDSTGDINSSYAYDPYGKEVDLDKAKQTSKIKANSEFSLMANPFGYESEYKDSESGLIYLRARYYSPRLMRFISRDTADLPNRYNYADGNPISNVDPSGHMAWWAKGLIGTASAIVGDLALGPLGGVALDAASQGIIDGTEGDSKSKIGEDVGISIGSSAIGIGFNQILKRSGSVSEVSNRTFGRIGSVKAARENLRDKTAYGFEDTANLESRNNNFNKSNYDVQDEVSKEKAKPAKRYWFNRHIPALHKEIENNHGFVFKDADIVSASFTAKKVDVNFFSNVYKTEKYNIVVKQDDEYHEFINDGINAKYNKYSVNKSGSFNSNSSGDFCDPDNSTASNDMGYFNTF